MVIADYLPPLPWKGPPIPRYVLEYNNVVVERAELVENELFYNARGEEVRIATAREVRLVHKPTDSYLDYLYSPRHRLGEMGSLLVWKLRAGIGTALVRIAEEDMRTQRVTTVWLNATGFDQLGSRDMAMAFWTAMGYEPMATPAITKKLGWIPETFLVKKL